VANDTDYFRRTGMDVPLGQAPFTMVSDRCWYIPNAIDTRRFNDDGRPRERVVLVPRNIRRSRGIHLASEGFARFVKSHPGYKLHFAGGQLRGEYYQYCAGLIHKLGLTDSVTFLGEVDYRIVKELYQSAELTLIPTIAFEGTSYSALEAMACGSAVLSTPVGGLSDLPTEKSLANPEAIAEGLERLLSDRIQIATRQKDIVNEVFNIGRWRDAWTEVIDWRMSLPD
jgi:glycosyltransferase involved in cell wall biosynthesis